MISRSTDIHAALKSRQRGFFTLPGGIGAGRPSGGGGGGGDPYFAYVVLLLHAEGANGSTSFLDSSSNTKTVTAYNSAQLSTANASAGVSSMYFNSSSSHARVTANSDFTFETQDFTLECWINYSSYAGSRPIGMFNGNVGVVQLYIASGQLGVETNDSAGGVGGSIPLDDWTHIAVSRSSGVVRSFAGGVKAYEYTDSRSLASPANININQYGAASGFGGVGYIDEVRFTRGVARYVSDFVPDRAAFPDF